jgi:tetratricopeptide (TPR) repeat protein
MPRNVREVHDLATAATSIGRRAEAIQLLQLIIESSTSLHGTADDYFNAAVQAASIRDLELAKAINLQGLKHYPDNIDLLTDYADNCGKTGDIVEAERIWKNLADNPRAKTSWRYWIFYSDFLERQGYLDEAYELLETAKQHMPNPSMAYREQAEQMENRGRFEDAISLYQEALKHNPSEDIARLKLAQLLFNLGRLEEALEHVNWAIRYVLPRNARYFTSHYYKGQILLAMGKKDEAKRALQVAAVHDEDAQVLLTSIALEDGSLDSDTISKVYKL